MPSFGRLPVAALRLAAYIMAAGALTWPLAAHLGTHLPYTNFICRFDPYQSIWALAWQTHALATDPAHIARANIYHPAPDALFYGQLGTGALPVFAPVFLATGNPVAAANVTLILGLALTAWGLHQVVMRWCGSEAGGTVAGAVFLTNNWILWTFVPTAPHWAALFYFPWIVLLAAGAPRGPAVLGLVALVVLQALTDVVYVAPVVLAPLGLVALLRLLRRGSRATGLRLLAVLAASSLLLLPVVGGYLRVRAANPALAKQTNWAMAEATFPTVLLDRVFRTPVPFVITPVIGGLLIIGVLAAAWQMARGTSVTGPAHWGHAALWALVGGLLSLTPLVKVGSEIFFTPQWYAMHALPALRAIRVPSRLGAAGLVGIALLCGLSTASLLGVRPGWRRVGRALVVVAVVGLLYREHLRAQTPDVEGLYRPYPLHPAPVTPAALRPFLHASRGPLLELPLGLRFVGPVDHGRAMFESIGHWRPLLNGYGSFWPAGFSERMTLAARLPDAAALDELRHTTGLELIRVRTRKMPRHERRAWQQAMLRPRGLRLLTSAPNDLLFALAPPPEGGAPAPTLAPR